MITVLRRSESKAADELACEQALHLGGIVKSRRARGTREKTRHRGGGGGEGRERRKFWAGQLGPLSIYFDFRNVIFQLMVFPFVKTKYKWNFMRGRCKFSFPRPLAASPLARPNRRACSHATNEFLTAWKIWPDTLFPRNFERLDV